MMLMLVLAASFAVAQGSTLQDVQNDAGDIIVQSSQIKGQVNVLLQQMGNGNGNGNGNNSGWQGLDQSFGTLQLTVATLEERVADLGSANTNRILTGKTTILIRHMMLMSDEKLSFRNRGDSGAGARLRSGMQELKNLAQDIRQEVIGMKNN